MVVPVFVGMSMAGGGEHTHHMHRDAGRRRRSGAPRHRPARRGLSGVTAFIAVLVFEKLGVGILRRAWFNLDLIWASALVVTGALTLSL